MVIGLITMRQILRLVFVLATFHRVVNSLSYLTRRWAAVNPATEGNLEREEDPKSALYISILAAIIRQLAANDL
jgi:hypothetical protein